MSQETLPVYIDRDRKNEVKAKAATADVPMKELMQRLVDHGMALNLHELPLDEDVDEFYDELDKIDNTQ